MVRPEVVRHLDWIIFESLFQLNYSSLVCLFCSTLQYSTTLLYSTLLYSTLIYSTLLYCILKLTHYQRMGVFMREKPLQNFHAFTLFDRYCLLLEAVCRAGTIQAPINSCSSPVGHSSHSRYVHMGSVLYVALCSVYKFPSPSQLPKALTCGCSAVYSEKSLFQSQKQGA